VTQWTFSVSGSAGQNDARASFWRIELPEGAKALLVNKRFDGRSLFDVVEQESWGPANDTGSI